MAELQGITEVFSVGGCYDLIAIMRVADNDTLAALVTEQMQAQRLALDSDYLTTRLLTID